MKNDFPACFDQVHDRRVWSSAKWEKYRGSDIIPLWIADMDFPVAPVIQQAVMAHAAHGNYGYMSPPHDLADTLVKYHDVHYRWDIEPEWIVWLSGLVLGINLAVRACCAPGDGVLTFSPVYPPFLNAAPVQGRRTLEVPLQLDESAALAGALHYRIDFDRLEATVTRDTSLLLLCHPHNPVGSLFSAAELRLLAEFCLRHELYVCSDEVHCDLILDGTTRHVPFARVLAETAPDAAPALLARTITLHGPGKAFNIAGLGIAWAIIPDAGLREGFQATMQRLVPDACCFGFTALHAALRDGEPWRQAMLAQLRRNRDMVSAALDAMRLPHSHPAATYLTWIDARRLSARVGNAAAWFEQAGVGLSDGADFGAPHFLRLNFAAPEPLLNAALRRMQEAVSRLDAS